MSNGEDVRNFILSYLTENPTTDATDEKFHEEFYERFGGKRQATFYSAQMVYKAQWWLKRMCDEKLLRRSRFGISDAPASGFPKWVYVYSLWGY